jgi:hypothetical protein
MFAGEITVIAVTFARFDGFLASRLFFGGLHSYIGEFHAVWECVSHGAGT